MELEEAPTTAENVPAGQGMRVEFMGQKDPAGHKTGMPVTQLYDAGHAAQEEEPTGLKLPAAQLVQANALVASLYEPAGQGCGEPAPAGQKEPGAHGVHAAAEEEPTGA